MPTKLISASGRSRVIIIAPRLRDPSRPRGFHWLVGIEPTNTFFFDAPSVLAGISDFRHGYKPSKKKKSASSLSGVVIIAPRLRDPSTPSLAEWESNPPILVSLKDDELQTASSALAGI